MNKPMEFRIFSFNKLLVFATLVIFQISAYADSTPFKSVHDIGFQILKDHQPVAEFDSICVQIEYNDFDTIEVATFVRTSHLFSLEEHANSFQVRARINIRYFNIIVFQDGQKIESGKIENIHGGLFYTFKLSGNKLILKSSLLNTKTGEYLISLLITMILEILVVLAFYRKAVLKQRKFLFFILSFIVLNFITHFFLCFIYSHLTVSLLLLELSVTASEFFYWKFVIRLNLRKSISVCIITNLVSFLFGFLPIL